MPDPARNGRRIEQLFRIVDIEANAIGAFDEVEEQVEVHRAFRIGCHPRLQAVKREVLAEPFEIELHASQRLHAAAAFSIETAHKRAERVVLVIERREDSLSRALEMTIERFGEIERCPDRQEVDAVANKCLLVEQRLSAGRNGEDHVRVVGEPPQQCLE